MDIIKLWEKSFQNDAQSLILLAFHYEKGDSVDENKEKLIPTGFHIL